MDKGNESEYAPYLNYLREQRHGQLPSDWSIAGKNLLSVVLGIGKDRQLLPPYFPFGYVDSFRTDCGGRNEDEINAFLMVIQRGWDELLVPVYDMMSHRNGKWLNTKDDYVKDAYETNNFVKVRAKRDIQAGEEIYMSYNFCNDCGNRAYYYGSF